MNIKWISERYDLSIDLCISIITKYSIEHVSTLDEFIAGCYALRKDSNENADLEEDLKAICKMSDTGIRAYYAGILLRKLIEGNNKITSDLMNQSTQ